MLNKIRSVNEKKGLQLQTQSKGTVIHFYLTHFLNKVKALHLQVFEKTVGKLVIFPRIILNVNYTSKLVLIMVNPHITWSFKSCLQTFFDHKVGTSGKKRKQSDDIKRDKKEKLLLLITKIHAKGIMKRDTNQQSFPVASTISLANKKYLTSWPEIPVIYKKTSYG